MSILDGLTLTCKVEPECSEPLQTPVTIIDLERGPVVDMRLPMADPCPLCGGHRMQVGDWVCWGTCYRCVDDAAEHGGQ